MLKTRRKESGNVRGGGELKRLRTRLAEAEETLDAIRKGEVDAITVEGPDGRQIFTLESADLPYRTLVERMNEGAASMNGEGVILFCNERLGEMLGTRPEKLIGRSIFGLVVPAEKEAMGRLLEQGLRDEGRGEISLRSDEGTVVPALVSLKATPGEAQEEVDVCLIATDLGERKRHEEESRIREESLRLALKAGHSGTFDWEFGRNVVRWSGGSEEVYGLPEGGFGGNYEEWERMVLPEDVEIPRADIRESLRSSEYCSEFRIRRQNDGAIRWVQARGKVLFDDAGQPIRMVGTNTDITERKQGEEASRAARARLESVLDGLPVMVCLLTRDYDVAFANHAFRKHFGECKGRKCYDYCFKKTEPCEFCEAFQVLETRAPHDWEVATPDGRLIHAYDFPFIDTDGSPMILEMNLDITDQRRTEEIVAAERQKFRNILDNLPPYVVLLTPDYHVAFANREFRQRFGESHGRRCYEFLFERSEPCEVCNTYEVLKTGGPVNWKWTGPDGRHYDIYDFPFTDTDGSRLILEMGIDITEQKRAEEGLRAASLYGRSLIEASLDPLVTISSEGKITDVNLATEVATGRSREELIGSDFSDYFTEPEKAREGYQQVFEQGTVRDYPLAIRHESGRITEVLYNASVYRDESGEVQGIFAAARDITAQKAAEAALEQKAAELARSNEELAQFAYVASHDLQEPLRKIVAFGDRLVDHSSAALDEQSRDYLERMQNAAKRMGQLIESLLELSRVTTKGGEFAAVDLNAVLSEVLTDLEVRIQQTNAQVEVGPLPTVMADRSQMRQLFQNLIGNALKFHREDVPPVIQVSGQQKTGKWEIHVTDNGIGFDEKYTDRIFRPFQRLHGKNVFEGSGMGLAICSKIMARHAGQITAHSQPGKGSDFVLTLPTRSKIREARAT